jgi:hypothetical protein
MIDLAPEKKFLKAFPLLSPETVAEARERAHNIVIGLNNCATNDPCVLCRERTDPNVGPELFLAGTWALVCRKCGRKNAPELLDLIEEQECNLFDNVEEVFLEGKQDEVITQVGRKQIRGVLRGETGGLPDWIVAKIREKYSARAAAVSAVCDEGATLLDDNDRI